MKLFGMLRGLTAVIVIVVLGVLAMLLSGWPWARKAAWGAIAFVAAIGAWNEITSG
jgi:hypothetical protein